MSLFKPLNRQWSEELADLIRQADRELIITSPYIGGAGIDLVKRNVRTPLRKTGRLLVLTDLSPLSICQGATDLSAIAGLFRVVPSCLLTHLPKVHAKIYISDSQRAIITSGNLTAGGLYNNYEYGVSISEPSLVARIKTDVQAYSRLGAEIGQDKLERYKVAVDRMTIAYGDRTNDVSVVHRTEFESSLRDAQDELIRYRLSGLAVHAVFAETILYLLERYGPLSTKELHPLIQATHPDLCDDTIDRVIDGTRFGKKWKHAVRTAQQHLKEQGAIERLTDTWRIVIN